jgi:hypothetical protein
MQNRVPTYWNLDMFAPYPPSVSIFIIEIVVKISYQYI